MFESERLAERVRTMRLLLVEDESDVRNYYKLIFEHEGFEVTASTDAHEAARAVMSHPFDIAVIDERLPDNRGIALLRWIHRRFPQMRLVVASAYAEWEMYFRACGLGANDVVSKGGPISELLRVVKHALPAGI